MQVMQTVCNTNGKGFYTATATAVAIVGVELRLYSLTPESGELKVYFDASKWDVRKNSLIYSDPLFEREFKAYLTSQGLVGDDIMYSEFGMQGKDYVSFDFDQDFKQSWEDKFGTITVE